MLNTPRRIAALILILICICCFAQAEDIVDITIARGEHWSIPEDRLGAFEISDDSILAVEDGRLIGLKPGRAEIRLDGPHPTTYRVLVLFAQAAETEDETPDEAPAADYRLYTVSDSDEDEDEKQETEAPDPDEDAVTDEPEAEAPAESDDKEDVPGAAEPEDEPETAGPDEADEEQTESNESEESADVTIQSYDRTKVPEAINTVIDFALNEWKAADNKTFSRLGSKNKYSYWQCGKGPKCNIGWCGAFLGYVFDTCGIPMDEPTKSETHESGEPYSVRAAGVGKINKGFDKMERLSMVPKPGYLVIYGEQKGYGYKHIGLVTDVDDLGGGRYLLKTVEGNMSNRIKRYCYVFDSNEALKNTQPCPEEYRRDDGEINDYEHIKTWNITTFCQTWF